MKKIIVLIIIVISCSISAQTVSWNIVDSFDNFSYSSSVCRIDSNNNIYTKYSSRPSQFGTNLTHIEKYNSNGQRVTTFGTNGVLEIHSLLPGTGSKAIFSFEITNDQKLLFLARSGTFLYFMRITSEGTLDTTLNGTGIKQILTDTNRYYEHFSPSMIKGGDTYFMLDNFNTIQNTRIAEVHCFNDSGDLVTSFFNQGHLVVNYGPIYTSYSAIGSLFYINNALYISGIGYVNSTTFDRFLSKLNPITSQPDANFGSNGQLLFNDKVPSLIQANGKILEIRTNNISPAQQDLVVTRYLSDGTIDTSFATNGTLTLSFPWTIYSTVVPYNLPNGDIFLHHRLSLFASDRDAIMYITNSGQINSSFGGNIIDNGNVILGTFGLPTFRANAGSLSFGADYFVTTSERQPAPQSVATTKVNFNFPLLSSSENTLHGFKIFPNPSHSEIYIESINTFTAVSIYNMEGRLLKTMQLGNPLLFYKVDISAFSKGVYIVKVDSENKRHIQKLIKN